MATPIEIKNIRNEIEEDHLKIDKLLKNIMVYYKNMDTQLMTDQDIKNMMRDVLIDHFKMEEERIDKLVSDTVVINRHKHEHMRIILAIETGQIGIKNIMAVLLDHEINYDHGILTAPYKAS